MLPWMSTAWFGMATKLPGRTAPSAGMNRPPGGRFEDRDAQDIADAECDVARPLIAPEAGQPRQVLGQDIDDFRRDLDDRIVEARRVALAGNDIRGGRAVHRHPTAAAQRRRQGQRRQGQDSAPKSH